MARSSPRAWMIIGSLAVLAAVEIWRVVATLREVPELGWSGIAAAALAGRAALLVLAAAALGGALRRRYWRVWAARAAAIGVLATVAGHLFISGRPRLEDLLLAVLGLACLHGGSARLDGSAETSLARRALEALRGWAAAATLGAAPLVLAAATPTVAQRLGGSPIAMGVAIALLAAALGAGGWLLLTLRDAAGFATALVAEGVAMYLFRDVLTSTWIAHPALAMLLPAALVTALGAAVFALGRLAALRRRTRSV